MKTALMAAMTCDNEREADRGGNPERPLTHSLDIGEEGLAMEATRTCSIEGCDRSVIVRTMCRSHYDRLRRKGHPGPAAFRLKMPTSRLCREPGCKRAVGAHGARGWCAKHYVRVKVQGDPQKLGYRGNGLFGAAHPLWVADAASYAVLHDRIRRERGLAAEHACSHCAGPAADWAYDHGDLTEKTDPKTGMAYSLNVAHYFPLCKSCHKLYDLARRRGGERIG